jgi:UDP-glucose 4-epimerase
MVYLVTGGAGFIGWHIVRKLLSDGHKVRILDWAKEAHTGNILETDDLETFVPGVDYILHQAAIPSVQRSLGTPLPTNRVNVEGTLNLLIAAQKYGVKRFVFASSSSVYGHQRLPKTEFQRCRPMSPYAVSKYAGEMYCHVFHEIHGVPVVILRYFNVFGPHQKADSLYAAIIPKLLRAAQTGDTVPIYGDGEQTRDFTYVENVVKANLLACETDGIEGGVFNVATGVETSLNQLIGVIERITGTQVATTCQKERKGDVRHSVASVDRIKHAMPAYVPGIGLKEGLKQTWEWMQS